MCSQDSPVEKGYTSMTKPDGENFYILRYKEVVLAHTWFIPTLYQLQPDSLPLQRGEHFDH